MGTAIITLRIVGGQSLFDTVRLRARDGRSVTLRGTMVKMLLTILLLSAPTRPSRANDAVPHAVAVAVARAEIMSGVRIEQQVAPVDAEPRDRKTRLPKPRERPCPDVGKTPCRLFVTDMP
jgi:hypothetical protein